MATSNQIKYALEAQPEKKICQRNVAPPKSLPTALELSHNTGQYCRVKFMWSVWKPHVHTKAYTIQRCYSRLVNSDNFFFPDNFVAAPFMLLSIWNVSFAWKEWCTEISLGAVDILQKKVAEIRTSWGQQGSYHVQKCFHCRKRNENQQISLAGVAFNPMPWSESFGTHDNLSRLTLGCPLNTLVLGNKLELTQTQGCCTADQNLMVLAEKFMFSSVVSEFRVFHISNQISQNEEDWQCIRSRNIQNTKGSFDFREPTFLLGLMVRLGLCSLLSTLVIVFQVLLLKQIKLDFCAQMRVRLSSHVFRSSSLTSCHQFLSVMNLCPNERENSASGWESQANPTSGK